MKAYFPYIKALVFDVDYTLYRHAEYYDSQGTSMVKKYAETKNEPLDDVIKSFSELRQTLGENGNKASHTLTLETLGIPVAEQSKWKNELFKPELYLKKDDRLVAVMHRLSSLYKLFAYTNNTQQVASKTLEVLGVFNYFEKVWGSENIGEAKPSIKPYRMASAQYNLPMHSIVAIGDRYQVDLVKPVEHGVAGILVESMSDTYDLAELLAAPVG